MLALNNAQRYFLYRGVTDIRKGFDGLSGIVRDELRENPLSGDVFIFFNRKRTHVKLLMWDRDGFAIYYKRLERGVFEVPAGKDTAQVITSQTLLLILQGILLGSVRHKKRYVKVA